MNDLDIDIQEIWPELYSREPFKTRVAPVEQVSGRLMVTRFQYKGPMFDLPKGVFDFPAPAEISGSGFPPGTLKFWICPPDSIWPETG